MTPERWRRLQELLAETSALNAAERAAYLDEACAGDPELRSEARSLIEAGSQVSGDLRETVGRAAHALSRAHLDRRIGAYRVVDELGRGGMGVVLLAERDDDEYRTRVAIKLLLRGLESPQAVARFRDERQILAELEHPGIVRLLDGGSTEDGLPYLVMEHVEGTPITTYVERHGHSIRERVALFRAVCAAVQFAHQRLVIHRDLKPSNILVKPDGSPKLLDFGIAKLLDARNEVGREARTGTGLQPFTPSYASPEQLRGQAASTASDVYSLGLVLYELLTGKKAQHVAAGSLDDLRRIVEEPIARPSAVAPPAIRRAVAGDLDNILLRALEKDPARRYASVEQLAADLENWLLGLPVTARAGTLAYRTGKFVRRHRLLVAAVAAVTVALSAATAVSLVQARRAEAQARRAERRFQDVRRLANSLLFEVDDKLRNGGATAARHLIVSRALEYLDGLSREVEGDAALALELATAYTKLGEIQASQFMPSLAQADEALASYGKALAILDRLAAAGHSDVATRWALARAHYGRSSAFDTKNDQASRYASMSSAVRQLESLPATGDFDYDMAANAYVQLASVEIERRDQAAAERTAKAGLELAARRVALDPRGGARYRLAVAYELRGLLRGSRADAEGAAEDFQAARAMLDGLVAEDPGSSAYRRELFASLVFVAGALGGVGNGSTWWAHVGDHARAEQDLARAAGLAEAVADGDAGDARSGIEAAIVLTIQGVKLGQRDPAAGLEILERARRRLDALTPAGRASGYNRQNEAFTRCSLAEALAKAGRHVEAAQEANAGLALAQAVAAGPEPCLTSRLALDTCGVEAARAHHLGGDDRAALAALAGAQRDLWSLVLDHRAPEIQAYVGVVETLLLQAEILPSQRCALQAEALAVWRGWPYPTAFTRRREAELRRALAACPDGHPSLAVQSPHLSH